MKNKYGKYIRVRKYEFINYSTMNHKIMIRLENEYVKTKKTLTNCIFLTIMNIIEIDIIYLFTVKNQVNPTNKWEL